MFSVRLPSTIIEALRLLAEQNRRTVATQTLIVIEEGLKALADDGRSPARSVG